MYHVCSISSIIFSRLYTKKSPPSWFTANALNDIKSSPEDEL